MNNKVKLTKFITVTGMLSAIAVVLYTYAEFPILPAYAFLQYDFSDVVAIIGGIMIAPLAGIIIQVIKNIIHFLLKSATGGIGELANLLTGLLLVVPTVFLFKKIKLYSLIVGSVCFITGAIILNYFIFLPLYGVPDEARASMLKLGITPFNIIKSVLTSATTIVVWRLLKPFKDRIKL